MAAISFCHFGDTFLNQKSVIELARNILPSAGTVVQFLKAMSLQCTGIYWQSIIDCGKLNSITSSVASLKSTIVPHGTSKSTSNNEVARAPNTITSFF